jgi:uncharacterized protein YndB with AHSA1/START domain
MKTVNGTLAIEKTYPADAKKVWKSLTDPVEMRQWYFHLPGFKPEPGYKFEFTGGTDEIQYKHFCEVTEAVPGKLLAYTWRYEANPGDSEVRFELFPEGNSTRVRMTHTGIDSFAGSNPDLHVKNFEEGWSDIMNRMLWEHLEHAPVPGD